MTPPSDPACGLSGPGGETPPAVSVCLTLRKRSDFLRAAQAYRQGTPGFLLQARRRDPDPDRGSIRIGYTCSKKVGNAVTRNRAKRRLRAAARAVLPLEGLAGWDYVLVGRPDATVTRDFAALVDDLRRALAAIARKLP